MKLSSVNMNSDLIFNFKEDGNSGSFLLTSNDKQPVYFYTFNVALCLQNDDTPAKKYEEGTLKTGETVNFYPEHTFLVVIANQAAAFKQMSLEDFLFYAPKTGEPMIKLKSIGAEISKVQGQDQKNFRCYSFFLFKKDSLIYEVAAAKSSKKFIDGFVKMTPEFFSAEEFSKGLTAFGRLPAKKNQPQCEFVQTEQPVALTNTIVALANVSSKREKVLRDAVSAGQSAPNEPFLFQANPQTNDSPNAVVGMPSGEEVKPIPCEYEILTCQAADCNSSDSFLKLDGCFVRVGLWIAFFILMLGCIFVAYKLYKSLSK